MKFSVTTTIEASPEKVWGILTDAAKYPEWDPNMKKLEGTIALGQKVKAHTTFSDRAFPAKVTQLVPNQKMVWTGGMPLGLFKGERTFNLSATEGGTEFSMQEEFSGPLLGLFKGTIPDLTESFQTFAQGLKGHAEQ